MTSTELTIPAVAVELAALLELPARPRGLVVFVHGSGSSRLSPRNQQVAVALGQAGLATLRFDLSSAADAAVAAEGLAPEVCRERLLAVLAWLERQPRLQGLLPVGLFGASSGAAVALLAAASRPEAIAAVVSRGGRPDLAGAALEQVHAPTLLIVGAADPVVVALNRQAAARLHCRHRLVVVPEADHLFQAPGSLERVAQLARDWYFAALPPGAAAAEAGGGRTTPHP